MLGKFERLLEPTTPSLKVSVNPTADNSATEVGDEEGFLQAVIFDVQAVDGHGHAVTVTLSRMDMLVFVDQILEAAAGSLP